MKNNIIFLLLLFFLFSLVFMFCEKQTTPQKQQKQTIEIGVNGPIKTGGINAGGIKINANPTTELNINKEFEENLKFFNEKLKTSKKDEDDDDDNEDDNDDNDDDDDDEDDDKKDSKSTKPSFKNTANSFLLKKNLEGIKTPLFSLDNKTKNLIMINGYNESVNLLDVSGLGSKISSKHEINFQKRREKENDKYEKRNKIWESEIFLGEKNPSLIKNAMDLGLENVKKIEALTATEKEHWMNSLYNFILLKEKYPKFSNKAFQILSNFAVSSSKGNGFENPKSTERDRKKMTPLFLLENSFQWIKNKHLNTSKKSDQIKIVFKMVEKLSDFSTINFEHNKLRKIVNYCIKNLFKNVKNENEMKQLLIKHYKGLDIFLKEKDQKIQDYLESFRQTAHFLNKFYRRKDRRAKKPNRFIPKKILIVLREWKNMISLLNNAIGDLYLVERTGSNFPFMNMTTLMDNYVSIIRKFYKIYPMDEKIYIKYIKKEKDAPEIMENAILKQGFHELVYFVTHFIYSYCDYSMWSFKKSMFKVFKPEYDFLKSALKLSIFQFEDFDMAGEILDCLQLMNKDSKNLLIVKRGKQAILDNIQKIVNSGDVHLIHTAITGLIDHSYAKPIHLKSIKDIIPFKLYLQRFRNVGLMKKSQNFYREEEKNQTDILKEIEKMKKKIQSLEKEKKKIKPKTTKTTTKQKQ